MKTAKVLTAALIAGGTVLGAQQAMAYGTLGDFYVRANTTSTVGISSGGHQNHAFAGALGWKFTDKFGVEFNMPTKKIDYTSKSYGGNGGVNAKYTTYTLLGQYYPLGGEASQVQPYGGVGATYTRFDDRGQGSTKLDSDNWAPTVQLGVDYYLTSWLAANANVQFTPNKVKGTNGYDRDFNPLRVGAGLTFRF